MNIEARTLIGSAITEITAAAKLLAADLPGLAVDALAVAEGHIRAARKALCDEANGLEHNANLSRTDADEATRR